jgi:flagellar hook assembly protein FlgD
MADIHAFPNPVRPGYDGPIAVKGFTRDALVHITDARGHVVHSATAFGGQAVWDGRNQQGEPVASGTYFVFASDSAGNMRSVAKILILR